MQDIQETLFYNSNTYACKVIALGFVLISNRNYTYNYHKYYSCFHDRQLQFAVKQYLFQKVFRSKVNVSIFCTLFLCV